MPIDFANSTLQDSSTIIATDSTKTRRAAGACCFMRRAHRTPCVSSTALASLTTLPHSNNDRVANRGVHDSLSPASSSAAQQEPALHQVPSSKVQPRFASIGGFEEQQPS